MSQVQMAALTLAGFIVVFALVGFMVWRSRRTAVAAPAGLSVPKAAPSAPSAPSERKMPKLGRKSREPEPVAEISPSRLARVSAKSPIDRLAESVIDEYSYPPTGEFTPAPPVADYPVADTIADEPADAPALSDLAPEVAEYADAADVGADAQPDYVVAEVTDTDSSDTVVADEEYEAAPEQTEFSVATEVAEAADADASTEAPMASFAERPMVAVRLVPQIPLREPAGSGSWLGGAPRLPEYLEWPLIDGEPGVFLAQIRCNDLPYNLWDGLGPRDGWLAVFAHPRSYRVEVLHFDEAGEVVELPTAINDPDGWFGPQGGIRFGDLAELAVPAFPEWPVDLVTVRAEGEDPLVAEEPNAPGNELYTNGYDIVDPAFHPFDWDSMAAMAFILEKRLQRLWIDVLPDVDASEAEQAALAALTAQNREARARAEEIIAIIGETAGHENFSAEDAGAVMAALSDIQWVKAAYVTDPDSGERSLQCQSLSLTTHDANADLWVHDYQTILFDHAKHVWCHDPELLPPATRAFFEPLWAALAARQMAGIGGKPYRYVRDFDPAQEVMLLELPTSGLMSRIFGDGDSMVLTMKKSDLEQDDFTHLRAQQSS